MELIKLKLKKIEYRGNSIGEDICVEIEVQGDKLKIEEKIKLGETREFNREIGRIEVLKNPVSVDVSIILTEKDFLFPDVGKIRRKITIDTEKGLPQQFDFEVEVFENRSKIWKRGKKAVFTIELSAGNDTGRIALYSDIDSYMKDAKMRKEPDDKSGIIEKLPNHSEIEILKIGEKGNYPAGHFSDLWHKVRHNGQIGFIHSSVIEIDGEERPLMIEEIKRKAKELGIDEKLAVNLAYSESHWLPFAFGSKKADDKGIYQLTPDTIKDINEKYGGNVFNPYDPFQNIDGGLRYLKYLLGRYAGSKNPLERTIAAWNAGPTEVLVTGNFDLKNYPQSTQDLVDGVFKKRFGEKIMKALGIIVFVLLLSIPVFGPTIAQELREEFLCDPHTQGKGKAVAVYDEKCDEVLRFTLKDFYSDKPNVELSEAEKEEGRLHSEGPVIKDKKDNIYFFITEAGFCGSGGCTLTLYQYDTNNKKLKTIGGDWIRGLVNLQLSPYERFLALSFDDGKWDPNTYLRVIDLKNGKINEVDIKDKGLPSNNIEDMRWISDKKIRFISTYYDGGYDDPFKTHSRIIRHKEFFYDAAQDNLTINQVTEEEKPLDDSAG